MSNTEIEKRLAALEAEVALLKSKVVETKETSKEPWWKQHVGVFADDHAHEEAMRLGREYRESQQMVYDDEEEEK